MTSEQRFERLEDAVINLADKLNKLERRLAKMRTEVNKKNTGIREIGFLQKLENPPDDEQYNDEKLEEIPLPHGRNTKIQSAGRKQ